MLDRDDATINIVTSCDNAYAQHTAVFLKSLFKQNQNSCRIFILVPNDFIHRATLERNLSSHVSDLEFLTISLPEKASFKVYGHVTVATYFRLFLDKVIPANVSRVIYLDSDVLINGPLDELWAVDLQGHVIAAVSDSLCNNQPLREEIGKRIGLAPDLDLLQRWRYGNRSLSLEKRAAGGPCTRLCARPS